MVFSLSLFDLSLIGIYFLVLTLVGYLASRKQKTEDYLIAERKLGTFRTMATVNASKTGSIIIIFVSLVYLWGFSALWYFIGAAIGMLFFIPFACKLKEHSQKFYTLAHYFRYNYGETSALIASALTIFLLFGSLVINLMACSKMLLFFSGWPFWICAVIVACFVLFYLVMAGFEAVVQTDILQYAAIFSILCLLVYLLFDSALIPASEWDLFHADRKSVLGFFIIGIIYPFAMPDLWQRVYAARDKSAVKKGFLLSIAVYVILAFLLGLLALTVKIQFPDIDPDFALFHAFATLLPSGMVGIAIVLLLAAMMSSMDTYIFTAASAIVQDFFQVDKTTTIRYMREAIVEITILAVSIAILVQNLIIGSYIFIAPAVVLAVVVISTLLHRRIRQGALLWGFCIGILGYITYVVISLKQGNVEPVIVLITLGASILGLLIGEGYSFLTPKKQHKN